eukprot:1883174-Ditylum_brightwellii.AAC.1
MQGVCSAYKITAETIAPNPPCVTDPLEVKFRLGRWGGDVGGVMDQKRFEHALQPGTPGTAI